VSIALAMVIYWPFARAWLKAKAPLARAVEEHSCRSAHAADRDEGTVH
jgi:hypothetical protein